MISREEIRRASSVEIATRGAASPEAVRRTGAAGSELRSAAGVPSRPAGVGDACRVARAPRVRAPPRMTPEPPPPDACLFFDVDGTLVDIAPTPDAVRVAPGLLDDLSAAERLCGGALALVSGRSIAQIDGIFAPRRFAASGVHGAEFRFADGETRTAAEPIPAAVRDAVLEMARAFPASLVEDKGFSIAVHYRASPAHGAAPARRAGADPEDVERSRARAPARAFRLRAEAARRRQGCRHRGADAPPALRGALPALPRRRRDRSAGLRRRRGARRTRLRGRPGSSGHPRHLRGSRRRAGLAPSLQRDGLMATLNRSCIDAPAPAATVAAVGDGWPALAAGAGSRRASAEMLVSTARSSVSRVGVETRVPAGTRSWESGR